MLDLRNKPLIPIWRLETKTMDWTEPNHDILRIVAKKMKEISDFVRLRAVCKSWRSIVHLSDFVQQSPSILVPTLMDNTSFEFQFNQCFSQRVHTVLINNFSQDIMPIFVYSSLSDYLLFYMPTNSKRWLIINPLTRFHTLLPFGRKVPFAFPIYFGHSCHPKTKSRQNGIDVVFMLEDNEPPRSIDNYEICLWQYDDMMWRKIGGVSTSYGKEHVTYNNNGILCVASPETGYTVFIDISTGTKSMVRCPSMGVTYLVERGGDLLCVIRTDTLKKKQIHDTGYQFEVYELENLGANPCIRKLNSIGNCVIFINKSTYALCLDASECEGYESNCIYHKTLARSGKTEKLVTVKYNIVNNKAEVDSDSPDSELFIPSLF